MNNQASSLNPPPKPSKTLQNIQPPENRSASNLNLGGKFQPPLPTNGPTDGAPAPVDLDTSVAQPVRIDSLKHGRTHVNLLIGASLASVNNGGRGLVARGRVLDVDCGAALGVVIGVGGVVHHLDGESDDEVAV